MQWKSLASMYGQNYFIFLNVKCFKTCCRPSDHIGQLSQFTEHCYTHTHTHTLARHSSAAQSNQSCLYMTQSVQYVWAVQYSICVYTETAKRILCVWAWERKRERECVYLRVSMYKYVCIETKLSAVWGVRYLQLLFLYGVNSTLVSLFIHTHTQHLYTRWYLISFMLVWLQSLLWPLQRLCQTPVPFPPLLLLLITTTTNKCFHYVKSENSEKLA